jgi:uncharacterized protein
MKAMKNIIGKPVAGEDFFGRERELQELSRISEDEHVLLLAPRRVGKTSLLCALAERVEKDASAVGVYVSVAAAKDEPQFVEAVLHAIYATQAGKRLKPNAIATWLQRHARRVRSIKVAGTGVDVDTSTREWQEEANRAFAGILQAPLPWLILIDELPIFVLTIANQDPTGGRVRSFLQWFRNLRQLPEASTHLRFVLAGSIGLDSVTRRHRLTDTINDLRDWRLGPYDAEIADQFLAKLAQSYKVTVGHDLRRRMCKQAEWLIPYHLQIIFSALRERARGTAPTEVQLEAAIEDLLGRRAYFSSWEERLRGAFGIPEDTFVRAMLAVCARDPNGVMTSSLQQCLANLVPDPIERGKTVHWLLDVLQSDGYLVEHAGRWRFRSGLLRRYWERHVL